MKNKFVTILENEKFRLGTIKIGKDYGCEGYQYYEFRSLYR